MEKKMSDEEMLEAMEQAVKMHFMAFQQFMKQTGGDIGLSLQLTTSYMAAMLKGAQEQNEKEMEQIDIALLIGLGIKLAGAENQSGGPHGNLNSRFRAA